MVLSAVTVVENRYYLKTICGFIRPDEGMVKIRGEVLGARIDFPENVGVFINSPGYIEIYSGFKNLQYLAAINKKNNRYPN